MPETPKKEVYASQKTYVASTDEEIEKVATYILATEEEKADYMKIDLPLEDNKSQESVIPESKDEAIKMAAEDNLWEQDQKRILNSYRKNGGSRLCLGGQILILMQHQDKRHEK